MSRTAKTTVSTAALVFVALAVARTSQAQTIAYDHRSTAFGDYAAGASELVRARGAFLRDEAAAAEQWVRVASLNDQLWYQRAEYNYQVKQMKLNYLQQKATINRERAQYETAADEAAARQLLQTAKRAGVMWPEALTRPQYLGSMTLIDSILRNWTPEDPAGDAYRRSLATEVGVLRNRVANDQSIDFNARVQAVKTLSQLQVLANMPATGTAGPVGPAQQLAMR